MFNSMDKQHALVLGATGATGRELVKQLLAQPAFASVSIFVRKKPDFEDDKLKVHEIDFLKLKSYQNLIFGDVLFSALGTTLKDAGTKPKQYEVDYTYQYEFAKMASKNRVSQYSLVSTYGANKDSWFFYLKTKGALEEKIKKLPFKSIKIYQPPTLIRQADLLRTSEKRGICILNTLNRLGILRSQKPLLVSVLARKMIDQALLIKEGRTTYLPKDIKM
jgi:uncharacterized protein YbjT (DUF2867 family)